MIKRRSHSGREFTGQEIFGYLFLVRFPYLKSRSEEELRRNGVRISGIEQLDRERSREMVTTEVDIDRMFELWRSGVTVNVLNYADTLIIYDIIQTHILNWVDRIQHSVNNADAPIEDLILLDKFAGVVYKNAEAIFTPQEQKSALASNFRNIQELNFNNILGRLTTAAKEEPKDKTLGIKVNEGAVKYEEETGRPSYGQFFIDQADRVAKWRR